MEDKLKTVNAALVKAMADMKENENSETRNVFIQELLNAKLIVPSIIKPEPVDGKIAQNSRISFFSVRTKDKENILFLFTSAEELVKWAPAKGKHLILQNYNQFKDFVVGKKANYDGIVIDPYGSNITVKRGLIEAIDSAVKPMKIQHEQIDVEKDSLRAAEFASPGLYAALSELMARNETILSAWMMQAQREGQKLPTTIVVVDFKGGDMKNTFNSIARCANEFLAPDESIGIMPAYHRAAKQAVRSVKPFYVKGGESESFKAPSEDKEEE